MDQEAVRVTALWEASDAWTITGAIDYFRENGAGNIALMQTPRPVRLLDEDDPTRGLVFDGRIAEDFKLASGTWVSVGPLRADSDRGALSDRAGCGDCRPGSGLRGSVDRSGSEGVRTASPEGGHRLLGSRRATTRSWPGYACGCSDMPNEILARRAASGVQRSCPRRHRSMKARSRTKARSTSVRCCVVERSWSRRSTPRNRLRS